MGFSAFLLDFHPIHMDLGYSELVHIMEKWKILLRVLILLVIFPCEKKLVAHLATEVTKYKGWE